MKTIATSCAALLIYCLIAVPLSLKAQEDDWLGIDNLDLDSLSLDDSLSIFLLIDELMTTPKPSTSRLSLRGGYGNGSSTFENITNSRQNIFSALNYQHHSGLFSGVTGYFSNRYLPYFYNLGFSAGYNKITKKKWSYSFTYEYNWFNDVVERTNTGSLVDFGDLTHSISANVDYEIKSLTIGLDYTFFPGSYLQRLTPSISLFQYLNKIPILKQLVFAPTIYFLIGNDERLVGESQYYESTTLTRLRRITERNNLDIDNLSLDELSDGAVSFLQSNVASDIVLKRDFRALNALVTFPLLYTKGKWAFMASYSLNLPFRQVEPYEITYENDLVRILETQTYTPTTYQTSHYGSFSVNYRILK